jgi:hypothetical protein
MDAAAEETNDGRPLGHEARVRPGARGTPVEVCGAVWLFADYVPKLEPVWGRLFDQNQLAGRYDLGDLNSAAVRLLYANYDLTPGEAADLTLAAPAARLAKAVEAALFGPAEAHRTYTDWALGALYANGLDPASVPACRLRDVLDQLVATGRAVPAARWVSSAEYAAARAEAARGMGG